MSKTVKVRIPALRREIPFRRMTTSELRFYLYDSEGLILPEVDMKLPEEFISDDGVITSFFDMEELGFFSDIARILEVLYIVVENFESKVIPDLLKLDETEFSSAVLDLYKNSVLINPQIDIMASEVFMSQEPLDSDLERLASWLPNPIDRAIQQVVYKDSWADETMAGYELESDEKEGRAYEVDADDVIALTENEFELEPEKVRLLRDKLSEVVVGQEYAIDHVCAVARRVSAGFRDPSRPPAVMMFVGPTGVGKTLLAKASTESLFGNEAFGRVDCATLSERHDVSKLFGPPPGYVGYPSDRNGDPKEADPSVLWKETRGMVNGGVLLLDEVEKAHPDMWDAFLTIFDEGYAKTSVGNVIDFRNVIIVMTSNLGSYELAYEMNKQPLGFTTETRSVSCEPASPEEARAIKDTAMDAAREYMKPELLGRLSAIVPFTNLSDEQLMKVVELEWAKASKHIGSRIDSKIELKEDLKNRIVELSSGRGTGARFISRLVDGYVVDPLADLYVNDPGAFSDSKNIVIDHSGSDDCDLDVVTLEYGPPKKRKSYDYSVSMTIGDE